MVHASLTRGPLLGKANCDPCSSCSLRQVPKSSTLHLCVRPRTQGSKEACAGRQCSKRPSNPIPPHCATPMHRPAAHPAKLSLGQTYYLPRLMGYLEALNNHGFAYSSALLDVRCTHDRHEARYYYCIRYTGHTPGETHYKH